MVNSSLGPSTDEILASLGYGPKTPPKTREQILEESLRSVTQGMPGSSSGAYSKSPIDMTQASKGVDAGILSPEAFYKKYGEPLANYQARQTAPTKSGGLLSSAVKGLVSGVASSRNELLKNAPLVNKVADATTKVAQSNPTVNRAVAAVEKAAGKTGGIPTPAATAAGSVSMYKDAINPAITTAQDRARVAGSTVQDRLDVANSTLNDMARRSQTTLEDILSGAKDWMQGKGSVPITAPQVPGLASGAAYGNAGAGYDPLASGAAISAPGMGFQGVQDTSQYTPQQAALLSTILQRAQGQGGPSPAELMLAAQNQRAVNDAMAMAASQSGRALPVAQRQIMQQQALGAQQAAQQAAIMRAQEMLQAQQLGAQSLQGARGQDLALAQFNQQQQQAANERDYNAKLDAAKANAANALGWNQAQLQSATTQRGQDVSLQEAALQAESTRQAGIQKRQDALVQGALGGLMSAYTGNKGSTAGGAA